MTGVAPRSWRPRLRLTRLHLASRRVPLALAIIAGCAVLLWVALRRDWTAYGAVQLPLLFETACAVVIAATTASPFGEPERATGRWLPLLRLSATLGLAAAAVGALSAAGTDGQLVGGPLAVLRNLVGLTGIGLVCATLLGGALAWVGPATYMMIAVYAVYTQWHGPALTTPWIWPARPPEDIGAAICAGLVFAVGTLAITLRGARDPAGA
jgi:hypothetical protein